MIDQLQRSPYAKQIADEINSRYEKEKESVSKNLIKNEDRENLIFAISGKWGEGKTSLLELIRTELDKLKFKVIEFNPWKYSQADITLKRAFLKKIHKDLESTVSLKSLYYDKSETEISLRSFWEKNNEFFTTFFAIFLSISVVLLIIFQPTPENISSLLAKGIATALNIGLVSLLLIPLLIKAITVNRSSASITTAEEFEEKFNELLNGHQRIVIFVDDLDRCNPQTIKLILDSLKTFFQHPECSYIITGDHTVIERYATSEVNNTNSEQDKISQNEEGRRFLKKLFHVYWRLPLPTPLQFEKYVNGLLKESKIEFSDEQVDNIRALLLNDKLFERNPRHVKRFITKVRFSHQSIGLHIKELEKVDEEKN